MKRVLCLILAVLTMMSVLAGCGGTGDDSGTNADGQIVIKIGIPKNVNVLDYENNLYTQWLEEQTGYDIQFVEFPAEAGDYKTKISTMMASNQRLPDILWNFKFGDDLANSYGEQGYFIDLKPYYDDKELSKNFWESFEYLPDKDQDWFYYKIENQEDGGWYSVPGLSVTMVDNMDFMPWINQEWLDYVQMDIPENKEQLEAVLRAFKNTPDVNQNGLIGDEIPCFGSTGMGGDVVGWLVNMYIYCNDATYTNLDENGKVVIPYIQNEYREALKWVNSLMAEGLVSKLSLTYTEKQVKMALASEDTIGLVLGHPTVLWDPGDDTILKWQNIPMWGNVYLNENTQLYNNFITKYCKHPEAAFEILMAMCSLEGGYRMRYGEYKVDWDYADEGATSIMGIPATIKVYRDIWADMDSKCWHYTGCGIYLYAENEGVQLTGQETEDQLKKYDMFQKLYASYQNSIENICPDKELICPRLKWEEIDNDIIKKVDRTNVRSVFKSWRSQFVNGSKDPNVQADWDAYLTELNRTGLENYIRATQQVVDRMKAQAEQ